MLPAGTGQKCVRDEPPERLQKRVISSAAVKYLSECASLSFSTKIAMIIKKCTGRGSLQALCEIVSEYKQLTCCTSVFSTFHLIEQEPTRRYFKKPLRS